MKIKLLFCLAAFLFVQSCSDNIVQQPFVSFPIVQYYPIGSKSQLEWQESKLCLFIHYGMNTFTGVEWGNGKELPSQFNPEKVDTDQWVSTAKSAGFKYIILTVKHHDGFCLWPSKYTEHSIKNSPYKVGKGDIVQEFINSCRRYDVKAGFYISPWDMHESTYGSDDYNIYFRNQLIELCTKYGEIGEFWFDGARDPSYPAQNYDWDLFYSTIRKYQPRALIAIVGPDIRWIGNESGLGNETEWCIQQQSYNIQPSDHNGRVWHPSECDVSIRPGWFYHENENAQVKSVDSLVELYFFTVGMNSNLLLNVPPDKEGVFSTFDTNALEGFNEKLNSIFNYDVFINQQITASDYREDYNPRLCIDKNKYTFWVTNKDVLTAEIIITLDNQSNLNIIQLEEEISYGQRIKSFSIYYEENGEWVYLMDGTTIGRTRILRFQKITTAGIKVIIHDSHAPPTLRTISGFYYPPFN